MNSTEEISTYKETSHNFYTPSKKTAYFEYDFTDDKPAKKDKKWSFGNLFRRKKKVHDSSSEEEVKKTSSEKKKKKQDKKQKQITFDHVVITQPQVKSPGFISNGVLSDSTQIIGRHGNSVTPQIEGQSTFHFADGSIRNHPHQLSIDSIHRKSRQKLAKVRAEARRNSLNHNSSSDEDSQRSNSSNRFRSDESLTRLRDSSSSRRSRAARTERYLKRHSRDGENPSNYLRISKSDVESSFLKLSDDSTRSPSASPSQLKLSYSSVSSQSPSVMGLSTIPPSHVNNRFRVSNSTSNPSYKPPLSLNEYNIARTNSSQSSVNTLNNQRSISFDANIHRPQEDPQVIHAKLELGKPRSRNYTLVDSSQFRQSFNFHQPPPPPPRDPRRLHSIQYLETGNPASANLDTSPVQLRYNYSKDNSAPKGKQLNSANLRTTFKSSSEDHIPSDNQVPLLQRPSSTTPESNNRWLTRPELRSRSDNYQYLTDKQPRSRKPIFIQNGINKSLSQKEVRDDNKIILEPRGSAAFLNQLKARKSNRNSTSPQMFACETRVQNQIFLPSVLPNNNPEVDNAKLNSPELNTAEKTPDDNLDIVNRNLNEIDDKETIQRKSTNLEEALNELEAIYKSLKLGDENLLDMAEKRENEVAVQMLENRGIHPMWNSPRGTLSDSGFSYEPFDAADASKRKRYSRKCLRSDDMAFRKINREDRAATINDPQNVASKVSYLLTSPIYSGDHPERNTNSNEPDITFDDVVYRNIKQSNKMKVPEHPPPFGIPLGPISLAANSDYLHAIPDKEADKSSGIPDIVKDDLAYRNLRKDNTNEPALPPVSADDLKNNNLSNSVLGTPRMDLSEFKKQRAIRSKSANIGSLISQEVIDRASRRNARDRDKETEYRTLADIADAMQTARQVLKDKERRIAENKIASMSDTDVGNLRYMRYPSLRKKDVDQRENFINGSSDMHTVYRQQEVINANGTKPVVQERISVQRPLVKEVTPDPVSSFEDSRLRPLFRTNSFEDALTALAIEAKEASDKFTRDLKEFDENQCSKFEVPKSENQRDEVRDVNEASSEPVNLCKKLLEAVVDSTQHISSPTKTAEGSRCHEDDPEIMESVASIVFSKKPNKDVVESDHDYENISSDVELKIESRTKSPLEEYEDQIKIAFKELNLDNNLREKNVNLPQEEPDYCNLSPDGQRVESCRKSPGEPCVDVVQSVAFKPISECAWLKLPNTTNRECFSEEKNSPEHCESDDGFHSQSSVLERSSVSSNDNSIKSFQAPKLELSASLKSPKLVLESSKLKGNSSSATEGNGSFNNNERAGSRSEIGHIPDNFKSSGAWHNNPATLAIACCYGIACFHQLASSDLFAVMSIIFAVLTFIAALFI